MAKPTCFLAMRSGDQHGTPIGRVNAGPRCTSLSTFQDPKTIEGYGWQSFTPAAASQNPAASVDVRVHRRSQSPSPHLKEIGTWRQASFAAQDPAHGFRLSTLHVSPRELPRITRRRSGWLGLTPTVDFHLLSFARTYPERSLSVMAKSGHSWRPRSTSAYGRVGMWRGAGRIGLSVSAATVWPVPQ